MLQRPWEFKSIVPGHDLWSKLTDGVLAAAVFFLLWLIVALAIRPIQLMFGRSGLLIYALCLLAISMFSFQQSLMSRRPDYLRAWYGSAGGLIGWSVILVTTSLGMPTAAQPAGIIILTMVGMMVGLLWRNHLPMGARFFALTILLSWAEMMLMNLEAWLTNFSPIFTLTYRATGYLAILGAFLTLGWILFQTRKRIQRLSGALIIWFLVSLALYVFRGSLF